MGKIFNKCGDDIFYHCSAIDKGFTRDEWGKFCEDTRYTDAIVGCYFGEFGMVQGTEKQHPENPKRNQQGNI